MVMGSLKMSSSYGSNCPFHHRCGIPMERPAGSTTSKKATSLVALFGLTCQILCMHIWDLGRLNFVVPTDLCSLSHGSEIGNW